MLKNLTYKVLATGAALVQYGCVAHCVFEYCSGPSMFPTIHTNDVVLTERFSVSRRNIKIGDIVIVKSPQSPGENICKRVCGLEGDWIDNPSPKSLHKYIPKGYIWLEGDNKNQSLDSRIYGPIPYALITSKVIYKVWPPKDIGVLAAKTNR